MSRGPGRVQRAIMALLESEPAHRFTTEELAISVFGSSPTVSHIETVRQSLNKLGLRKSRAGHRKSGGWHYVWGA